jgi:hypothetical protein
MRPLTITLAIAALAFASERADALSCYLILDRNDAVLYQDAVPPVDMSDAGAIARSDIRSRGQFLMMMDVDRCPRFVAANGPSAAPAAVEEIVAGMRSYGGATAGVRPTGRAPVGTR